MSTDRAVVLTKAQKRAAKRAYKAVVWYDTVMSDLCSDPMTHAMGAPVGDFAEDWSRRHRKMLGECLKDENNTEQVREMLFGEFDRYLP